MFFLVAKTIKIWFHTNKKKRTNKKKHTNFVPSY